LAKKKLLDATESDKEAATRTFDAARDKAFAERKHWNGWWQRFDETLREVHASQTEVKKLTTEGEWGPDGVGFRLFSGIHTQGVTFEDRVFLSWHHAMAYNLIPIAGSLDVWLGPDGGEEPDEVCSVFDLNWTYAKLGRYFHDNEGPQIPGFSNAGEGEEIVLPTVETEAHGHETLKLEVNPKIRLIASHHRRLLFELA
jgi:hypothetical protein